MSFDDTVPKSTIYVHAIVSLCVGVACVLMYIAVTSYRTRVLVLFFMILLSLLSTNAVSQHNTKLRNLQNMALVHFYMTTFYLFYITIWRRVDAYVGLINTSVSLLHVVGGTFFVYGRQLFSKRKHIVSTPTLVFGIITFYPINVLSTMTRSELYGKYMVFSLAYFALMYAVVFYTKYEDINGRSYMFCATMWMLVCNPFHSPVVALAYMFGLLATLLCIVGFWHTGQQEGRESPDEHI